jgi:hydroxyisourate hydrolase
VVQWRAVPSAGQLTTHVLDVARGRPAAGVELELVRIDVGSPTAGVVRAVTNAGGRTDAPLIAPGALEVGVYELRFFVGAYFAEIDGELPFLDVVPVRFGVADPDAHYHVPLLATPWSYSTYRGS